MRYQLVLDMPTCRHSSLMDLPSAILVDLILSGKSGTSTSIVFKIFILLSVVFTYLYLKLVTQQLTDILKQPKLMNKGNGLCNLFVLQMQYHRKKLSRPENLNSS
jgi:hypothetical protein